MEGKCLNIWSFTVVVLIVMQIRGMEVQAGLEARSRRHEEGTKHDEKHVAEETQEED